MVESYDELIDLVKLLYRVNKHSLALPCHHAETEQVVHRNMRMGIGMAGYLQATDEQKKWLTPCYEELRNFDKEYSAAHGWPASIKLTTMKPGGTLPLLPGVASGCHAAYAQYLIRRIRIASNSPLVDVCRSHGYPIEYQTNFDGSLDYSTVVVSFPFSYPEGTPVADEFSAIEQLETVKRLQQEWSDNSVSCTIYYKKEELPEIQEYLRKNYNKTFKSLSFLLHSGHNFAQAPLEMVTKEAYDALVASTRLITSVDSVGEFLADDGCAQGVCPVR